MHNRKQKQKDLQLTTAALVPEKWFFVAFVAILVDYAICLPYTLFIAGSESDTSTLDDSLTKIYILERSYKQTPLLILLEVTMSSVHPSMGYLP